MYQRLANISKTNSFFLFGARGVGKSCLLERHFKPENSFTVDLLQTETLAQLQARPDLLLNLLDKNKKEWCIIDEVQKVPAILDVVHSAIEKKQQKFALTGSSARKLKRGASNLLAGRAFVFKMFPLTSTELGSDFELDKVLSYGSLPKIFSYQETRDKILYLKAYAETYLREEILIEQIIRNLPPFRKFLEISAQADTEIIHYSNIARDILVDPKIVSNYFSILDETLLGFYLDSYHTSLRKRQKKAPKFYWFDLGVRRALTGTVDYEVTPKSFEYGSLFESFIVNEIMRSLSYSEKSFKLSYVRLDDTIEVDLIIERPGLPTYLVEIKSTDRVNEIHAKNLKKLHSLIKNSVPVILSRDPVNKAIDGVSCLNWKDGLREIGVSVPT